LISWGLILVLIAFNGMPVTVAEAQAQLLVTIMVFLGGPLISGLLMIGLVDGREGFRDLLSRLFKWRISLFYYAVALLTALLVFTAVHYLLSMFSPVYSPGFLGSNGPSLVSLSIMSGIVVGICCGHLDQHGPSAAGSFQVDEMSGGESRVGPWTRP
jgi:hypothetical protein